MKMRKILSLALAFVFLFSMLPATAVMVNADEPASLDSLTYNSTDGYYEISSIEDWNTLAAYVADGNSCAGLIFKMTADIGTETAPVTRPIGQQTGSSKLTRMRFAGTFDGGNHTLNVTLNSSDSYFTKAGGKYVAPFSLTAGATIKNLHVTGTITSSGAFVSGLVGSTGIDSDEAKNADHASAYPDKTCTIDNCRISVTIYNNFVVSGSSYSNAGGMVSIAEGKTTITNSVFDGKLLSNNLDNEGKSDSYAHSGGIIGHNKSGETIVSNCAFIPSEVVPGKKTVDDTSDPFVHESSSGIDHELEDVYYNENGSGFGKLSADDQASTHKIDTTITEIPDPPYIEVTICGITYYITDPDELNRYPQFKSKSLTLSGKIGVNFFMNLPTADGVDYTDSYMTFEITGKGKDLITKRADYNANFTDQNNNGYYGFTCYISSIQMADTITATFHYGDTKPEITTEYKVADYFTYYDNNPSVFGSDSDMCAVIESLANYGHYIQPFLASANGWTLGDGDNQYAAMEKSYALPYTLQQVESAVSDLGIVKAWTGNNSDRDIAEENITFKLILGSETTLCVYFRYDGTLSSVTVDGDSFTPTKKGGRYIVSIPNISAHELSTTHTIVVETANGTTTVTVSALSYVKAMLDNAPTGDLSSTYKNAARALYCYSKAADDYKANQNHSN